MHYTSRSVYEFISKQTNDPIVERKTCRVSGTEFPIYQSDLDFYKKITPLSKNPLESSFDKGGGDEGAGGFIPTPTLCPEERQRRRLLFRNERKLYKRTCDASQKSIISIYSPDKPYKVYDYTFRHTDKRNASDYAFDIDFSKSFTENYSSLMLTVPQLSMMNSGDMEGCAYCNYGVNSKDSYLTFMAAWSENCLYSQIPIKCLHDVDGLFNIGCQYCYFCIDCNNCYKCKYCKTSFLCKESNYLESCNNCFSCSFCVGLQNKKFYILNKPLSEKEYLIEMSKIKSDGNYLNSLIEAFLQLKKDKTKISNNQIQSDFCYECNGYGGYKGFFSGRCLYCSDIMYSDNCFYSQHLFGCIGLRNKSYCILNKQYTKEEYETLVPKIIAHMQETGERGEFFDPSLSPFGYNETVAMEYFPLTREEALARGYKRQDNNYDPVIPEGTEVLKKNDIENLSEQLKNIGNESDPSKNSELKNFIDKLSTKIVVCEVSGRPFRLIRQELEFYHKHNLPLPSKHPDIRHEERMQQRPARELHLRHCDKCGVEMLSVYQSSLPSFGKGGGDRGAGGLKVYCETCYNKEIYG